MKINTLSNVLSAAIFMIFAMLTRADESESLQKWNEIIERGKVNEIANAFSHGEPKWPRLNSVEHPEFNEKVDRPWENLAEDLVETLRKDVASVRSAGNHLNAAKDYLAVEEGLRRADGYTNLLVANAYAQMAGLSLTKALVDKPELARTIQEILASRKAWEKLEIRRFFLDYIDDDLLLRDHVVFVKSLKENMSLFEAGIEIQRGIPEFGALKFPDTTIELIRQPAIGRLFTEIAASEMTLVALLPGLAEFYQRGGNEADLNRGNVQPFKNIMGGVERNYTYPLFRFVRRICVEFLP